MIEQLKIYCAYCEIECEGYDDPEYVGHVRKDAVKALETAHENGTYTAFYIETWINGKYIGHEEIQFTKMSEVKNG